MIRFISGVIILQGVGRVNFSLIKAGNKLPTSVVYDTWKDKKVACEEHIAPIR